MSHKETVRKNIEKLGASREIQEASLEWLKASVPYNYSYNFSWLDRPVIQYPQDVVALQEIIWSVKPDLVIETGIAHGGSLVLSASILTMLSLNDALQAGISYDPAAPDRKVLGIDIDIRQHNRTAIENHPMAPVIDMIEGSSIDPDIFAKVRDYAEGYRNILVILDSNHTHDHVLEELELYAPLTSVNSYCVVFDTVIEDLPGEMFPDRPWGPGNNPKTAVHEYLAGHPGFIIDKDVQHKLLITVAPDGYLKRIA